jgi:beta-lactamase class A
MFTRRTFLITSTLATAGTAFAEPARFTALSAKLTQLEKDNGGRLGVTVLDTASGERVVHRADERFAMCSTFKFLLAAAVLAKVDAGKENLTRTLSIPAQITLGSSPLTQLHAGSTMTIHDLCEAVITRSDNTAANLLLETIGGPAGITTYARSIGDKITRLDRNEMSLNEALPNDPRDTTSPNAMVGNLRTLLLGNRLSAASRELLTNWLIANITGQARIRAKLPANWRVGDKTGSNGENTTNNIAILWPPNHPPVLVAAYITECPGPEEKRNAMLAEIGRLVASCY